MKSGDLKRGEVAKDLWCPLTAGRGQCVSAACREGGYFGCDYLRFKWPSPAEFRKAYGEAPEGRPVWYFDENRGGWQLTLYETFLKMRGNGFFKKGGEADYGKPCYVACSPWGRPPKDRGPGL